MRLTCTSALLALALLFGCSGGGGSSVSVPAGDALVQNFSIGLVRSDAPTTLSLEVRKPFYPAAEVVLAAPPTGAFQPVAGSLPLYVESGESPSIWITFTPPGASAPAVQEGTIELLFCRIDGVGEDCPVTVKVEAEVETPSARILQTQVNVGNAAVGEAVPFGIYFENKSSASAVVLEEVTLPEGQFSIDPNGYPLPCPVGPSGRFFVKLLYTPTAEGPASSVVSFRHTASPLPLVATLSGNGIPQRVVFDYGSVPLDPVTFETPWLAFDVAPEGVGIFLEASGDPAALLDLVGFEGPSGRIYEDEDPAGPLDWMHTYPAGAHGSLYVELPNSMMPEVQLVPGGGTYRFRLRDAAAASDEIRVRATVAQRRAGKVKEGRLDLRVFLADGLSIANRSDPMSDAKLAAVLGTLDAILGAHGIRLGTITFSFLDPAYNVVAGVAATENLLATVTAGLPEGPLNLFLVKDMGVGVTGAAGAVPGPRANGTPYSGVVIDFDATQGITVGANAGHQITHYLGHHDEDGIETVLPEDGGIYPVLRHPLLNAGLPEDLVSPPEETNYPLIEMMVGTMAPMYKWCGTCMRPPLR